MKQTMRRTIAQHFRLTIATKILLGIVSGGILTILIALISLSSLQRLNEINNRIMERDIPLAETADSVPPQTELLFDPALTFSYFQTFLMRDLIFSLVLGESSHLP
jgi:uncharacterized membrane protein YkvI